MIKENALFDSSFISDLEKETFRHHMFFVCQLLNIRSIICRRQGIYAVSAVVNAAVWDERKMQDLSGLRFDNIPDSRPILFHPDGGLENIEGQKKRLGKNADYVYEMPMTGAEGEFQIPVGPVHAGIIEPGHFRFSVSGNQ